MDIIKNLIKSLRTISFFTCQGETTELIIQAKTKPELNLSSHETL